MATSTPSNASSWAMSSAVLPPPMTTARRTPSSRSPDSVLRRSMRWVAPWTPSPSSPGMPNRESAPSPRPRKTASCEASSSAADTWPGGLLPHLPARTQLDAPQGEDPLQLAQRLQALQLVGSDAQRVEAAGQRLALIEDARMPFQGEQPRRGDGSGPGAHQGDALA